MIPKPQFYDECNCKKVGELGDGSKPEFFNNEKRLYKRWLEAKGQTFLALHLDGRHLLGYHDHECLCYKCLVRDNRWVLSPCAPEYKDLLKEFGWVDT